MTRLHVRTLCSEDFEALNRLEADVFGGSGEDVRCPHYLRLCTELFAETCWLALADDRPVGSLLCFVRDREADCTTLAVRPEFQRTRVTLMLLAAFVQEVVELGAAEVGTVRDFYGAGDERIVSKIDRSMLEQLRPRYQRLGSIPRAAQREAA